MGVFRSLPGFAIRVEGLSMISSRRFIRPFFFLITFALLLGGTSLAALAQTGLEGAPQPGGDETAFQRTWARTDMPVKEGIVSRTWMWGESPNTPVLPEQYNDSPGGARKVLYYDKSRMEISDPEGDPNSIWYVTNGLLSTEMITGNLQLGDDDFEEHKPAVLNVAGDQDDLRGVTYMSFGPVLDQPPLALGSVISQTIDRASRVGDSPDAAAAGVPVAHIDEVTNHSIAGPFWLFMNSPGVVWNGQDYVQDLLFQNPYFATGRPITEPYWTEVKVGGVTKAVMVQCFERRCLTFTPQNSPGWQVEAGNTGQHYFFWRYQLVPNENPVPPTPDVIYQSTMADWPILLNPLRDDVSVGAPESYHMFNMPESFMSAHNGVLAADSIINIDVRRNSSNVDLSGLLTPDPSLGCLLFRSAPVPQAPITALQNYKYCVIYENDLAIGVQLIYYELGLDLIFGFESLGIWPFPTPVPANTWLNLGVTAIGDEIDLFVNGAPVASVTDNRLVAGEIGVQGFNGNPSGITDTEFRNLVVRLPLSLP